MRKVLLPFFACVCGSLTASAAVGDTFKFGDITYEVMSATAAEVSTVPTSITQAIEIPQTVQDGDGNSYTVVGVGERAFQYTKTPTVTLPPQLLMWIIAAFITVSFPRLNYLQPLLQ